MWCRSVAGTGHVDDWTLALPAEQVPVVTPDRLSPTALTRDRTGATSVRLTEAAGSGVETSWDGACPWVQIHTSDKGAGQPGHRTGLAVEPMTCAPDAFNADSYDDDAGLIVLEAGESTEASSRIATIA